MRPLSLPVVAVQGRQVRRRAVRLPEAAGPSRGEVTADDAPPITLALVGESTAAGVGADSHDRAMAGSLARSMSRRSGRSVAWSVHASSGATISHIGARLVPALQEPVELVLLLAGVNDVLRRTPVPEWRHDLHAVLTALSSRAERVAVAGLPPFAVFPSLPRLLAGYLDERGEALDAATRDACAAVPRARWISSRFLEEPPPGFFGVDGFHPSAAGYAWWADRIVPELSPEPA